MLSCHLSHEIQKEAAKQASILAQLPEKQRHALWVAQRIAYQIGWGRLLLSWYHAGIQGNTPQMPGDGFTKWDYNAIADHFYQKYLYDQGEKQQAHFQQMIAEVVAMVEQEHSTGNLERLGVWPWCTLASGKAWPLRKWIQVNTIAPWKATTALLKKSMHL